MVTIKSATPLLRIPGHECFAAIDNLTGGTVVVAIDDRLLMETRDFFSYLT